MSSDSDAYDVPKGINFNTNYDLPRPLSQTAVTEDNCIEKVCYDIPRPLNNILTQQLSTPSSSYSSLFLSDSISLSSSNRSSLINMPDYDIPRRISQTVRSTATSLATTPSGSVLQNYYDFPSNNQQPKLVKDLTLELNCALETLNHLQAEITNAVQKLLIYVTPKWRLPENLGPILIEIKLAAMRLKTSIRRLFEFAEGTYGNACKLEDKSLSNKLKPLVQALKTTERIIYDAFYNLDVNGWTVEVLSHTNMSKAQPPDSLDQLTACALTLIEDVRHFASFIQGNASLLFKRVETLSFTPTASSFGIGNNNEWFEDYDYVSLETKEATLKTNTDIKDAFSKDLKKNSESILKNVEKVSWDSKELDVKDKSLLIYFTIQTTTHINYLTQAIDAFLETVERNQPPKFFLNYAKFILMAAHPLISFGDIIHRKVKLPQIKNQVLSCSDALADALKQCVSKTKRAAQFFPSVTAVQEMVDSVVDISHFAHDFKMVMLQTIGPL